jgi:hypothetical protein
VSDLIFRRFILFHADTNFDELGDEVVAIGVSPNGFSVELFEKLFIGFDARLGH